jgi:hypothetical protein
MVEVHARLKSKRVKLAVLAGALIVVGTLAVSAGGGGGGRGGGGERRGRGGGG